MSKLITDTEFYKIKDMIKRDDKTRNIVKQSQRSRKTIQNIKKCLTYEEYVQSRKKIALRSKILRHKRQKKSTSVLTLTNKDAFDILMDELHDVNIYLRSINENIKSLQTKKRFWR